MSPEQARGEALDARTDLFSFGAVLYEMATGRRPFPERRPVVFHAILNGTGAGLAGERGRLPVELESIVQKALEKDREVRYQHAAEMRSDLKRLRRDSTSAAKVVSASPASGPASGSASTAGRRAGDAALVALAAAGRRGGRSWPSAAWPPRPSSSGAVPPPSRA